LPTDQPHLILGDGTPVLLRRFMTEDAARYPDLLREVTTEDLRLRFFSVPGAKRGAA
jgi:hypothetical protein